MAEYNTRSRWYSSGQGVLLAVVMTELLGGNNEYLVRNAIREHGHNPYTLGAATGASAPGGTCICALQAGDRGV